MITRVTFLLSFLLTSIAGFSQLSLDRQVIATLGHYEKVGSLELSYTSGELAIETAITTNGMLILTQGFQQPDTAGSFVGIDPPVAFPVEYSIFPNPTSGVLQVELVSDKPAVVMMDVYDLRGRKTIVPVQILRFTGTKSTVFNLEILSDGFYLFNFRDQKGKLLKTEKVQKIH
ncbi:MAG: T9SS type A sorting domain-containing protein [Bacteroidetes bacterium]|nr:T9SS type A sorting domain-containing protein [Bacteroidota bacterium]MCB0842664.1 T9SS type A sorting domain-containing protein [Bacteroidota bacterium]